MARGVKARWHRNKSRTAEENGSVLAAVAYKGAIQSIQRLLGADFELESDARRFAILAELLAFQIQMADRLAYGPLDEAGRHRLVNAMGKHLARLYDENRHEIETRETGEDPAARREFIGAMNGCLAEYAELPFAEDGRPGYGALRYFASRLAGLVQPEDKRWMIESIIDVEAPRVVDNLIKGWRLLYPANTGSGDGSVAS
ncbi:MAG: hypothetical protein R3298_06290 [Gammaproteobacteria bacterium]|nr:hypothetical protein [Gammaproteobacteria bacterium]